jgi:MFS family permease
MRRLLPDLLREPVFRRFWTGQTVSLFGDQIALLAIPLTAVLILHASAAQMGYLTAAELLPSLLFSVLAGTRVDRRGGRRRTMLVADVARAVLMATIPVAYLLGVLSLSQLYLVAFAVGTCDVLFFVAYNALFVSIVPAERYVEGHALLNGSRAMSFVGGQSLAGFLVGMLSAPGAVLLNALSFLGSALTLWRVNPAEPPTAEPGPGALSAGIRYIAGAPVVRAALGATATVNYFTFIFNTIFVLYATTRLHVRPAELGLVLGTGAVGGLIGAAVTARVSRRIGIGPAFVLSCVLFPAPLILVPLAAGSRPVILALLFLAEFGTGLGVMLLDISIGSIFAAVIPDHLKARVSGAYRTVNYGVRPVGALSGGLLGTVLGLRNTLWISALGGVLCVLWVLPGPVRRLKRLPPRIAAESLSS